MLDGHPCRAPLEPDGQLGHWPKVNMAQREASGTSLAGTVPIEAAAAAEELQADLPPDAHRTSSACAAPIRPACAARASARRKRTRSIFRKHWRVPGVGFEPDEAERAEQLRWIMPLDITASLKLTGLFAATAVAEIIGCYLPYLWLRHGKSIWLLAPAAASLALFVWLLTLHPHAAGRVYAAYGGVYVSVAILWLWLVESVRPTASDVIGVGVCILGMLIIMLGGRQA